MTDAIIEAAARALRDGDEVHAWDFFESEIREISLIVLAAVTPLIRAQVLEEAAQVGEKLTVLAPTAEDHADHIAVMIRALKD